MNIFSTLIISFLFASGAYSAFGQRTQASSSTGIAYRLQAQFHPGVAQAYEITETTSVIRTHSDSSKKSYGREVKYFATFRCIESHDGISTIVVNLDSLLYKFNSQGVDLAYDSQKDLTPKNFADLNNYFGPLNRPFNITVNSYGEVSKVEGEQIEFWRDYFIENKDGLDSVLYLIWMQSLDRENLLHYGDLQKRILPGRSYAIDSTWKSVLSMRIDGVVYSDTVTSKLAKYTGGYYEIITNDTIRALPQRIHVYGVPEISQLTDGYAGINNVLSLTTSGTVDEVVSVINAWFRASAGIETYTQNTTSTMKWKLTGQYQW
ncbi:MAG: hypothetical protein HYX66_03950 [Ignavibacteria bacterium]|nr:hypothetical protein [Ignavibacteria bacterium]